MQLFDEMEERVVVLDAKLRESEIDPAEKELLRSEVALIKQYMASLRHKLLGEPTGKYRRLETQEGDDDGQD